ncbi:MAG: hypothetical protein RMA76_15135 [Deltaproteobacteria bacterium]
MRRRVYVEHLPPDELGRAETVKLCATYGLEPIVALPPSRETPAMQAALRALDRGGLRVGVWPLLEDDEGYWPSAHNAASFERRVSQALAFTKAAGVSVRTVAIDLEPPLEELRGLLEGSGRSRFDYVRQRRRRALGGVDVFTRVAEQLGAEGIETIAAAIPLVVIDPAGVFWDHVLATPVAQVPWSVVSPMMYTTLARDVLRRRSEASVRALLYAGADRLRRAVGPRASVSVGLVGQGKLGTERVYGGPSELARDVGAVRAAGIDDLALFALEGVLDRNAPEVWLEAFVRAGPDRPDFLRRAWADGVLSAARVVTAVGGLATKR